MRIDCQYLHELTEEQLSSWARLCDEVPQLDSPFLHPMFARIVSQIRDDVEVAAMWEGDRAVGFVPFHRLENDIGKPIGLRLADLQAGVVSSEYAWDPQALVEACGLNAFRFERLMSPAQLYVSGCAHADSPYIDTSRGFDAYLEGLKARRSSTVAQVLRKQRKLEREVGPVRFEYDCDDRAVFDLMVARKSRQRIETATINVLEADWVRAVLEKVRRTSNDGFAGIVSVLYAADHPVAIHFGMRTEKTMHWWFPTYDAKFSAYSPGLILLLELARECSERGIQCLDLGEGDERYKRSFQSGARMLTRGSVDVRRVVGSLYQGWTRACDAVRESMALSAVVQVSKKTVRELLQPTYCE